MHEPLAAPMCIGQPRGSLKSLSLAGQGRAGSGLVSLWSLGSLARSREEHPQPWKLKELTTKMITLRCAAARKWFVPSVEPSHHVVNGIAQGSCVPDKRKAGPWAAVGCRGPVPAERVRQRAGHVPLATEPNMTIRWTQGGKS